MVDLVFYTKIDGDVSRPPLFMIHTVPLDSTYLLESLKGIKTDQTLVLLDLPSHGKSDDVSNEDVTFDFFVKKIDELRGQLGFKKIAIYGHGIGGFIAMKYAYTHQKRLSSLIVSNSAVNAYYRNQMAWNIRNTYSKLVKDAFEKSYGETDDKSIRMRLTQSLAAHFHPLDKEKAVYLMDSAHRIATEAYVLISHYQIQNYDIREKVRAVRCPTLILGGAYDVWPVSEVQKINTDIKQGEQQFFPSGHFPMIETGEKYWNYLFNWLAKN